MACKAVWTKVRARREGYSLEDVKCQLCGKGDDTIHHRLWKCKADEVVKARNAVASIKDIERATQAGATSCLHNRGLFAHPVDSWPEPAHGPEIQCFGPKGERVDTHAFSLCKDKSLLTGHAISMTSRS